MGLGQRNARKHDTQTVRVQGSADVSSDFQVGQKVITVDGFPGTITNIKDGAVSGTESFDVVLDGGIGGGDYSLSQIRPITAFKSDVVTHTAADDYPEFGDILETRPDIAINTKMGSFRVQAIDCPRCNDEIDQTTDSGELMCPTCGYNPDEQKGEHYREFNLHHESMPYSLNSRRTASNSTCKAPNCNKPTVTGSQGENNYCGDCGKQEFGYRTSDGRHLCYPCGEDYYRDDDEPGHWIDREELDDTEVENDGHPVKCEFCGDNLRGPGTGPNPLLTQASRKIAALNPNCPICKWDTHLLLGHEKNTVPDCEICAKKDHNFGWHEEDLYPDCAQCRHDTHLESNKIDTINCAYCEEKIHKDSDPRPNVSGASFTHDQKPRPYCSFCKIDAHDKGEHDKNQDPDCMRCMEDAHKNGPHNQGTTASRKTACAWCGCEMDPPTPSGHASVCPDCGKKVENHQNELSRTKFSREGSKKTANGDDEDFDYSNVSVGENYEESKAKEKGHKRHRGGATCPYCKYWGMNYEPGMSCPICGHRMVGSDDVANQVHDPSNFTDADRDEDAKDFGEQDETGSGSDLGNSSDDSSGSDSDGGSDGGGSGGASSTSSLNVDTLIAEAYLDSDFAFHVTAAWSDVRAKAKRIRSEGGVHIKLSSDGYVYADVRGDNNVYETGIQRLPGKQSVASWTCGCKWGAYHWGAPDDNSRFAGRMCFIPGTMVSMANGTHKPIEEIEPGDRVLTHDGVGTVLNRWENSYHGDIVGITRNGSSRTVWSTADHGMLANTAVRGQSNYLQHKSVQDKQAWGRVEARDLAVGDWVMSTYADEVRALPETQIAQLHEHLVEEAGRIHLATPSSVSARVYNTASLPEFAYSSAFAILIGYYLAEGNVEGYNVNKAPKMVQWTLGASEGHYAQEISEALEALGSPKPKIYSGKNRIVVKVSNAPLALLLAHLTGTHASKKSLHPDLMLAPLEFQEDLLRTYLNGDGCESKAATASIELARQIVTLGARLGHYVPRENVLTNNLGPANRNPGNPIYYVETAGRYMQGRDRLWENYYGSRIARIERDHYNGIVYNLNVDDQHTYAVEDQVVFNCSHALAVQFEAQSQGMFGKDIVEDTKKPKWVPRRVVVKYDIDDNKDIRVKSNLNVFEGSVADHVARLGDEDGYYTLLALTGSVNSPFGEVIVEQKQQTPGATKPRDLSENPASAGFASAPDDQGWGDMSVKTRDAEGVGSVYGFLNDEFLFEADLDTESTLHDDPEAALPRTDGSESTLHEEPEAALPSTDGNYVTRSSEPQLATLPQYRTDSKDINTDPWSKGHFINEEDGKQSELTSDYESLQSQGSVDDIVAQFQATASHLVGSDVGPAVGDSDIAKAAKQYLEKTSMKVFSPAEQSAIINEGQHVRAANYDRLNIEGTHYEQVEASLNEDEELENIFL